MSQITKPIALDETLQDVVTAIQNITQGGMIVATNNVGSATQPVYINGGVPTPMSGALAKTNGGTGNTIGKGESVNVNRIANDGDVNVDTYTTDTKATTHFDIAPGSASNVPADIWAVYQTMSGSGTGGDYAAQVAYSVTHDQIWFRRKGAGTWHPWHQIYGITTGTPTSPATGLSFQSGGFAVKKTGNIVTFRVVLEIGSGYTPSTSTPLFQLPFTPESQFCASVAIGRGGVGYEYALAYINAAKNVVLASTEGITKAVQGNVIQVYGSYMTND